MHFGLHLHNKGIITAEQFVSALEMQIKHLVPIGQLALEEGILSARSIFEILRAQSDAPHERFGELAIEMGLMDRDDLMRLLMIQTDRKLPLADILVQQGVLTKEQTVAELNDFRRERLRPRYADTTTTVVRARRRCPSSDAAVESIMAI